jgi:hypothetical protein
MVSLVSASCVGWVPENYDQSTVGISTDSAFARVAASCVGAHRTRGACFVCVTHSLTGLQGSGAITVAQRDVLAAEFYDGACANACIPMTCNMASTGCGAIQDGCGGTLQCGSCGPGTTCSGGRCEHLSVYGEKPNATVAPSVGSAACRAGRVASGVQATCPDGFLLDETCRCVRDRSKQLTPGAAAASCNPTQLGACVADADCCSGSCGPSGICCEAYPTYCPGRDGPVRKIGE